MARTGVAKTLSLMGFVTLLKESRDIILQDAAELIVSGKYPDSALFTHPILMSAEFADFLVGMKGQLASGENIEIDQLSFRTEWPLPWYPCLTR